MIFQTINLYSWGFLSHDTGQLSGRSRVAGISRQMSGCSCHGNISSWCGTSAEITMSPGDGYGAWKKHRRGRQKGDMDIPSGTNLSPWFHHSVGSGIFPAMMKPDALLRRFRVWFHQLATCSLYLTLAPTAAVHVLFFQVDLSLPPWTSSLPFFSLTHPLGGFLSQRAAHFHHPFRTMGFSMVNQPSSELGDPAWPWDHWLVHPSRSHLLIPRGTRGCGVPSPWCSAGSWATGWTRSKEVEPERCWSPAPWRLMNVADVGGTDVLFFFFE